MPTALLSAALLTLPSCTETPPPPSTEQAASRTYKPGVPGSVAVETTTVTANVASVFNSTREVVLDVPGNKRVTVTCGPEVVNFNQIKAGDQVKITYTEQVAVSMASPNDPPDTDGTTGIVALAPKGAQPGAVMAATKQVTATVTAIDMGLHAATLQFPDGTSRTFAVRPDVDLTKRKVGEKVVIRATDAMAIKVEKP
ncbi:MAG: hypothetical protein ACAI43_12735 [Phycisphaerae bacterium]|nr:hypothetical protein [Tepidisphaeraceae bacterium]